VSMVTKRKPPLEKTITRNIIRYLNTLPACYARKIHGSRYTAGFPDIICVREGICLWIEVKRPGKKPTALQVMELERWRECGCLTIVAYCVDDVRGIMQ
jgi:Holliday junction resolvase